jgi:hypothetical protein
MSLPTPEENAASPNLESDRRAVARTPCRVQVYYQPGGSGNSGTWRQALLIDVSTRGVRLQLDRPVEVGSDLTLALTVATAGGRRRVLRARVRRVDESDGSWTAGCAVLGDKLTEDDIRALPGAPSLLS